MIISVSGKVYHTLKDNGDTHYMVNHANTFVNPEDPEIHTQTAERVWCDLKEWVKRPGIRPSYVNQNLARYLFIKPTRGIIYITFW